MPRCENKVTVLVERGWTYKEVPIRCGSTGPHGDQVLCANCQWENKKKYPQGWINVPGDLCPHGNYIGDKGGPDYLCGLCEGG